MKAKSASDSGIFISVRIDMFTRPIIIDVTETRRDTEFIKRQKIVHLQNSKEYNVAIILYIPSEQILRNTVALISSKTGCLNSYSFYSNLALKT